MQELYGKTPTKKNPYIFEFLQNWIELRERKYRSSAKSYLAISKKTYYQWISSSMLKRYLRGPFLFTMF